MPTDSQPDDGALAGQRGTRATPRVRKFFRLLGFESGTDEE
ncbi:hypothetical protein [Halobacterium sp. CBA1126]|nr:hypothetical protein [Halobacterium sp. CBA1126]